MISEIDSSENFDLKVGVFICHCGGNISDKIDIERLKDSIECDVTEEYVNLCSLEGRKIIRDRIIHDDLDRVVVAACSPISHEKTFQKYIQPLNPYLLDMANIREQCSWVHDKTDASTDKAINLVNASINKVKESNELGTILCKSPKSAAIIGAGISGMTSAISLAKQGIETYLIEKTPSIGGEMAKIGKVFSPVKIAEECAMCLLNPIINEVVWNDKINVLTNTKVLSSRKRAGNFDLLIERSPRYVDENKCIVCGECEKVCPIEVPDKWNDGLSNRKAIYKPFSQAYPNAYNIDMENCIKCGKCQKVCRMNAIDLEDDVEVSPLTIGSVILATGHKMFDLEKRPEYGYNRYDDVITQMELGRIMGVNGPTKGELKTSKGKIPKRIVMIQCVGSRDDKPDGHKYCSKVCCMVALKNANVVKHKYPDTDIIICYTDIRTPGMYEKYFKHAQSSGIRLIRGRPGEVIQKGDKFLVRTEDTLQKQFIEIEADLVVLSTAMEPSQGTVEMANLMNVGMTEDLFVKENHPKIKPVATDIKGIYVCGTAQGPKDITESIMQSSAASAKVAEVMHEGIEVEPFIAHVKKKKCNTCGSCIEVCKYKSISIKEDEIYIDPVSCSGCGECLDICEKNAISIKGNIDEKIFATIDGILENKKEGEVRILTFLDHVGYVAADNIGVNRLKLPESIHIIKVISVNRILQKHITYAFEKGADGIFIGEYPGDPLYKNFGYKIDKMKEDLKENSINPERLEFSKVYIPYFSGLAERLNNFNEKVDKINYEEKLKES